jgi:hypothetical protein
MASQRRSGSDTKPTDAPRPSIVGKFFGGVKRVVVGLISSIGELIAVVWIRH